MTCKHCQHWISDTERLGISGWTIKDRTLGKCTRVKLLYDCSEWTDDEEVESRQLLPNHRNDTAFVEDGSDYSGALITTDNFFCSQYDGPQFDAEKHEEETYQSVLKQGVTEEQAQSITRVLFQAIRIEIVRFIIEATKRNTQTEARQ